MLKSRSAQCLFENIILVSTSNYQGLWGQNTGLHMQRGKGQVFLLPKSSADRAQETMKLGYTRMYQMRAIQEKCCLLNLNHSFCNILILLKGFLSKYWPGSPSLAAGTNWMQIYRAIITNCYHYLFLSKFHEQIYPALILMLHVGARMGNPGAPEGFRGEDFFHPSVVVGHPETSVQKFFEVDL